MRITRCQHKSASQYFAEILGENALIVHDSKTHGIHYIYLNDKLDFCGSEKRCNAQLLKTTKIFYLQVQNNSMTSTCIPCKTGILSFGRLDSSVGSMLATDKLDTSATQV